jgi:hypothetical protein
MLGEVIPELTAQISFPICDFLELYAVLGLEGFQELADTVLHSQLEGGSRQGNQLGIHMRCLCEGEGEVTLEINEVKGSLVG